MNSLTKISATILRTLNERNMTQKELAVIIGCHKSTLSTMITRPTKMRVKMLVNICNELQIPLLTEPK